MIWFIIAIISIIGIINTTKLASWEFYWFAIFNAALTIFIIIFLGIVFKLPWV